MIPFFFVTTQETRREAVDKEKFYVTLNFWLCLGSTSKVPYLSGSTKKIPCLKKEVQHFTKAVPSGGDKCPLKESWKVDS